VFAEDMAAEEESTGERIDLRRLPALLRLEFAYGLQCRRDEANVRLIPWQLQQIVNELAATGLTSLLAVSEEDWAASAPAPRLKKRLGALAFLRDAYRRIEALAVGRAGMWSTPGRCGGCATSGCTNRAPPWTSPTSASPGCGSWPNGGRTDS